MAPRRTGKGEEYVKLGVDTDVQSIDQYLAQMSRVEQKAQQLQIKLGQAYVEGNAAAQKAKSSFDTSTASLNKATKAADDLGKKYDEVGDKAEQAQKKGSFQLGIGEAARLGSTAVRFGQNVAQGDIGGILGDLARMKNELSSLAEEAKLAGIAGEGAAAGLTAVVAAAAPFIAVLGPIAVGFGVLYNEVQKGKASIEQGQKGVEAYYNAIITGNKKSIEAQIEGLQAQKLIQEKIRDANQGAIDRFKEDEKNADGAIENASYAFVELAGGINPLIDKVKSAQSQIDDLNIVIGALGEASKKAGPDLQAFVDDLEAGIAAANEGIEKQAAAEKFYADTLESVQEQKRDTFAKQLQIERQQEEKMVAVLQKRDADIDAINKRRNDAEIALNERTAETVAKITQSAIDANEAAFQKLQDKQNELVQSAGRAEEEADRKAAFDDLQTQIDDNRKERDELQAHLKKVRDIQRSFRAQERDAVYDRNFDQLFRLQENKKEQQDAEDAAYADQKKARQQAEKEQRDDTARQRAFERNERRIALNNALNDARSAYVKELDLQQKAADAQIRNAYAAAQKELELLNAKTTAEIETRRQGAIAELNLVAQTEAAKQAIFIKYLNEARALLGMGTTSQANTYQGNPTFTSLDTRGQRVTRLARGGWADAPFMYNDGRPGQRESFGGVMLPGGMGIAYPFRSGQVNPGSSGGDTYSVQMTFTGNNPQAIAEAVDRRLAMRFKKVVK